MTEHDDYPEPATLSAPVEVWVDLPGEEPLLLEPAAPGHDGPTWTFTMSPNGETTVSETSP